MESLLAITILKEPNFLEPDFQYSIPFKFSSTKATFSITGSYSYRSTINHTPKPDGTGLISPHDILKANLGYSINPFITSLTAATESIVHYRQALFEFYNPA